MNKHKIAEELSKLQAKNEIVMAEIDEDDEIVQCEMNGQYWNYMCPSCGIYNNIMESSIGCYHRCIKCEYGVIPDNTDAWEELQKELWEDDSPPRNANCLSYIFLGLAIVVVLFIILTATINIYYNIPQNIQSIQDTPLDKPAQTDVPPPRTRGPTGEPFPWVRPN